jgi:dTDP-4-amino-4,6-dideoxygalactose transaminase
VIRVGAIPVFADIGAHLNLDPARAREAISTRTRAIIPVHFAGHSADMDALLPIARSHGLTVIEDAAHAHGGSWKGTPVGAIGDIGSFSFQQSKNMTAGEGGILVGNNEELISSARSFFSQGRLPGGGWYDHPNLGTNQRLTGWQAAILLAQLHRLPEQIARRSTNAKYLDARIAGFDFIDADPPDPRVTCHSYYLYPLRLRPHMLESVDSATFTAALGAEGISGIGRYPRPLQENAVFQKYPTRVLECAHAYQICRDMFWVSHEIMLGQKKELDDFVDALSKVAAGVDELAARVG